RVVEVVEGELLALELLGRCDAGAALAGHIEGRLLMRVLAIAPRLLERGAERQHRREGLAAPGREPLGDRRIVSRGARIGETREPAAKRQSGRAGAALQLGDEL